MVREYIDEPDVVGQGSVAPSGLGEEVSLGGVPGTVCKGGERAGLFSVVLSGLRVEIFRTESLSTKQVAPLFCGVKTAINFMLPDYRACVLPVAAA